MLKLDSTLNLESFLHWWGEELLDCLPERMKRFFRRRSERLLVLPSDEKVRVILQSADGESLLGEFTLDETGRRARDRALGREPELRELETVLRLRRGQALRKVIVLPAATEENLRQVVGFEMSRYTPFNADQVYYETRVIERMPASGQIRVELVFVLRNNLEVIYEDMTAWGLRPTVVDYEEAVSVPGRRQTFNLLPETLRPATPRGPKIINGILAVSALLLLATVVALPLWLDYRLVDELEQKVRSEGRLAKEVEAIKDDADLLIRQTESLLEKKHQEPALVAVLDELTRLLPDNTYLTNLQYREHRLQIQGQSPAASALIEIIEASPLFRNTSFNSPVTQDRMSGLERFQISTQVIATGGA